MSYPPSSDKKSSPFNRVAWSVIGLMGFMLVLVLGILFYDLSGSSIGHLWSVISGHEAALQEVRSSVREIGEVALSRADTKVIAMNIEETQIQVLGAKITLPQWLSGTSATIQFSGSTKAGLDLSLYEGVEDRQITVSRDQVIVIIPRSKILSSGIDASSVKVMSVHRGLLQIVLDPEGAHLVEKIFGYQANAANDILRKACAKGVLEAADKKAADSITTKLMGKGYTTVQVQFFPAFDDRGCPSVEDDD